MSDEEKVTLLDKTINKNEVALTLAGLGIGGLFALTFLDYGSVALGVKQVAALPESINLFASATATTLLGYIIGKKSSE